MNRLKTVLCISTLLLLSCIGSAAVAAPEAGWWWNPGESGRGFFIESQDGITFIGGYFYDADGHATWLVAGGANDDSYNYTGPLYSELNGQTLFGNYVAPHAPDPVGTLTVHFSDDRHGTLTWPGGTIAIERTVFGGTDGSLFMPDTGWYWNSAESGSGYSIELQGRNLFIVGYMYDDSGRPVWYLSAGPMSSDRTYSGPVLQFANGQTMTGPYRPPGTPTTVARLDLEFTAWNEANVTFTASAATVKDAHVLAGPQTRTDHLTRTWGKKRNFPDRYSGLFTLTSTETITGMLQFQLFAIVSLTKGVFDPEIEAQPYVLPFDQVAPLLQITVVGTTPGCSADGRTTVSLPGDAVKLYLGEGKSYQISFKLPPAVVDATITCPPAGPVAIAFPFPGLAWYVANLTIQDRQSDGTGGPGAFYVNDLSAGEIAPGVSVTGSWSFIPQ